MHVPRSRLLALALAASVLSVATGCTRPDVSAVQRGAPASRSVTVVVVDNQFQPAELHVPAGATVTWKNDGVNQHNVTPVQEGSFEPIRTGTLDPGKTASRTFPSAGSYAYYCTIHGTPTKGQRGTIVVG